ncbi:MAG: ribosome assembly cofactor RimP, partial [Bacteroidales bacterium]|nr:ribosome assembly cofactor RimP [Bacteroidales bacterium]
MIDKNKILQILNSGDLEIDFFIVEVEVSSGNRIRVYVDNANGITIGNCAKISRFIEHRLLETDEELNFELNVSSPGIDIPFKVKQQYEKSIGKEVEIIDQDNRKIKGILLKASDNSIDIEEKRSVKIPGRKKKELILEVIT